MRICIVVPMYDEEAVAADSIRRILGGLKELPPVFTLLVVDDGSRDGTKMIVDGLISCLKSEADLQILSHPANRGYGAALRTGMDFALRSGYDYVLFMDSDMTNHPKYIKNFYEKMLEGCDYIKASRYRRGGGVEGVCLRNRLISRAGNFIARLSGLPLSDFTNGFRAVKVSLLKKLDLKENGFVVIMEELYQIKGLTNSICEIPYVLTSRSLGLGPSRFAYTPRTCLHYFKYVIKCLFKNVHRQRCEER